MTCGCLLNLLLISHRKNLTGQNQVLSSAATQYSNVGSTIVNRKILTFTIKKKEQRMKLTAVICTMVVVTLGIYDLVIGQIGGVNWTISRWVQRVGFDFPVVTFMLGYLCGHMLGYMKPETKEEREESEKRGY